MADVTLPQLGETVTEGTITQWFKQVGDTVAADEPLFEVSTDKVDTEVPSPVAGVLTEIRVPEGDTVDVGAVIAVIGDSDAGAAPAPAEAPPRTGGAAPHRRPAEPAAERRARRRAAAGAGRRRPPSPPPAPAPAAPAPPPAPAPALRAAGAGRRAAARDADNRLLSPVVRRLVNEHGIDPDAITGTGPGGRITRDDVLDYIDATGATPPGRRASSTRRPRRRHRPPPAAPAAAPRRQLRPRRTGAAPRPAPTPGERDTTVRLSKIRTLTGDHMVMSKATQPARVQRGRGRLRQRRRRAAKP